MGSRFFPFAENYLGNFKKHLLQLDHKRDVLNGTFDSNS